MNIIFKYLSTLGPIGYLPAPGTCATLATLPLLYYMAELEVVYQIIMILGLILVAAYCIKRALIYFNHRDPSYIVIDELVGCLITFIAIPITVPSVIAGFCLFRFFDILKPLGLKRLEYFGGYWGILFDDIGAGILSNIVLQMIGIFFIF